MMVELLEDAQTCLNQALEHMSMTTLDNMSWITKIDGSSVTCTNHITTSMRFHSYAQALQNMILTTIMTTAHSNAWKCHPPTVLNYSDEEYPILDGSKKQHVNKTDISTNVNIAGDTLMMNSNWCTNLNARPSSIRLQNSKMKWNKCSNNFSTCSNSSFNNLNSRWKWMYSNCSMILDNASKW